MIRVNCSKEQITITGHSNYDDLGKDIVCSAVSSIVTTTINGIISIKSDAINYVYRDDKLVINIIKNDFITKKLIDNMLDLLRKLSSDYPKNIMIKEGV